MLILIGLLVPGQLLAATICVPADEDTIQEAIEASNDGDTVLVAPGIYAGGINFYGRAITLRASTPYPHLHIIDCAQSFGIILEQILSPETMIRGFTLINARSTDGAAIYCNQANPTIINCVFLESLSISDGGAIYLYESNAEIYDCLFLSCSAETGGGIAGIRWYGLIDACTFIDCSSFREDNDGSGGGLSLNDSDITCTNSFFYQCRAEKGGAIALRYHSFLEITGSTLSHCFAESIGGGIYCQRETDSHLRQRGNTFLDNIPQNIYPPYSAQLIQILHPLQ